MSITKQKTKLISIAVGIAVIIALAFLIGSVVNGLTVSAADPKLSISADKTSIPQGSSPTITLAASATDLATPTDCVVEWYIEENANVMFKYQHYDSGWEIYWSVPTDLRVGTYTVTAYLWMDADPATPTDWEVVATKTITITVTAPVKTPAKLSITPSSATGYKGGSVNFKATVTNGTDGKNYVGGQYVWHQDSANGNTHIAYDSLGNATLYIAANDYSSVIKVWCTYEVAGLSTLTSENTVSVTITSQSTGIAYPTDGNFTVVLGTGTGNTDKTKASVSHGKFEIKDDGIMYVTLASADINLSNATDKFTLTVSQWDYISIYISPEVIAALGDKDLEIITEFGTIIISNEELKANSGGMTVVIRRGSIMFKILDKNGKEIADYNYPITVTLPYTLKDGENAANVVGYKVDGGIYPLGLYNAKTGTISFDVRTPGTYSVKYSKATHDDIDAAAWAEDYINFVTARGMFTSAGNFYPNDKVTRASFANELAKLDGVDLSKYTTSSFSDIPAGASYLAAVEWAVEAKIIEGIGDGKFGPDALVTREQMAAMFVRYLDSKGYLAAYKTPANLAALATAGVSFADADDISDWAKEPVAIMQIAGIIIGKPGNVFDPQGDATRAEVATIFDRFIKLVNDAK